MDLKGSLSSGFNEFSARAIVVDTDGGLCQIDLVSHLWFDQEMGSSVAIYNTLKRWRFGNWHAEFVSERTVASTQECRTSGRTWVPHHTTRHVLRQRCLRFLPNQSTDARVDCFVYPIDVQLNFLISAEESIWTGLSVRLRQRIPNYTFWCLRDKKVISSVIFMITSVSCVQVMAVTSITVRHTLVVSLLAC